MKRTTPSLALVIALFLTLGGCKKADAPASSDATMPASNDASAPAPTGLLGQATDAAKTQATLAAVPKPDLTRPLTDYGKLDSGQQIMFLYLAASRLPPDYEKVAAAFSADYRQTSDSFRKHDLMAALKPQIDVRLTAAVQQPYAWMEVEPGVGLGAYDFSRGGFPIGEFSRDNVRYFQDNTDYKLTWANGDAVAFAAVKDEAAARQIEAMRTDYSQQPRLKVYFFAQSADLDQKIVKAYVTRVQITDPNGRVLAEYGPAPAIPEGG